MRQTSAPNAVTLVNAEKQTAVVGKIALGDAVPIDVGKTGFLVLSTLESK